MAKMSMEALARKGVLVKSPFPGFQSPMLATLTKQFFDDADWIYERKFDGMRCVIVKKGKAVNLYSRNKKLLNKRFPEFSAPLLKCANSDLVADGEIVAFDQNRTSFKKLQKRLHSEQPENTRSRENRVFLYIFDLTYFKGYSLVDLPLVKRKQLLKQHISWSDPLRYTIYRREKGREYLQEACKKGWEGIIAKEGKSPYRNSRSTDWLKFKCVNGQELVIAGITQPRGGRIGFGALLVGFYDQGDLKYAGKVGTGFSDEFLKEWNLKFQKIRRETSPFSDFTDDRNGEHIWLEPVYVGQFEFTEWTDNNKLRHPSFLGLRRDKDPIEIIKEV